jgi:hypothetical protein
MLSCVLFVAIAICILATVVGVVALTRSALRLAPRLEHLRELTETGTLLVARAQEVTERAERVRADAERLRALAQPFS